jgi:molybdate transport system substrate-binding protein
MRRTAFKAGCLAAAGALLVGCSTPTGTSGASSSTSATASTSSISGTVTVLAAASLKEAFTKLGQRFEAAHPGTKVVFNFGPSSGLAIQINQGAPADVFASASTKSMDQVVSAGGAASPTNFASNVMEVALPPSNPAHVTQLSDLSKSSVKVALCDVAVPCGATAQKVFTNAKITVTPVTRETDVKAVLSKVTLGEVDAGVVYLTDVRSAGNKVQGLPIPSDVNASTKYPIATLTKAPNKAAAQAFTAYVLSPEGSRVLTAVGFAKP